MSGINEANLTPEQRTMNAAGQEQRESDFAEKLVSSLDLPATLSSAIEETHKESLSPKKQEQEEESSNEEESSEEEETEDGESEQEEGEEKEEDDLLPRSKVQKRFDELTQNNKRLEREVAGLKQKLNEPATKRDEETEKLENMNQDELKALKRQVRLQQVKSSSDEGAVSKLLDLEEKIDGVMRTAPVRFEQKQIQKFNEAVSQTSLPNFDKVKDEIFNYAKKVYSGSPELQGSVGGQARAWNLAVEHVSMLSKATAGKAKTDELERQVNTLKKKVSVDTSSQKATKQVDDDRKVFQKAKYGTEEDKANFFRKRLNTDSMIPAEFLNR